MYVCYCSRQRGYVSNREILPPPLTCETGESGGRLEPITPPLFPLLPEASAPNIPVRGRFSLNTHYFF